MDELMQKLTELNDLRLKNHVEPFITIEEFVEYNYCSLYTPGEDDKNVSACLDAYIQLEKGYK